MNIEQIVKQKVREKVEKTLSLAVAHLGKQKEFSKEEINQTAGAMRELSEVIIDVAVDQTIICLYDESQKQSNQRKAYQ